MTGREDLGAPSELIGRDGEAERLSNLIDHLRDGGDALLVIGEAGIGKSALLNHAGVRARALAMRTLVTAGVESEAELAFAGMHQLLRPVIEPMALLPEPQRSALDAAFGSGTDLEPDPFLVALAAHQLVCGAAEARPLVADRG